MQIHRQQQQELLFLLEHFPAVGLIGPRQAGKTTLAKSVIPQLRDQVLYLDLELDSDINKLENAQLFLSQFTDRCVVLDEIQRMPRLFPLLRALIDQNKQPGRFLLLGSASPHLIQQSSETLAGRIAFIELSPMNIMEIFDRIEMSRHWWQGGFPEPLLTEDERFRTVWMRNFIQTYLERDLRLLGLDVDPVLMRRFWSMLAHAHGQIWNASMFAKSLGISVPTVNRYLNFLENAFLVRRLQPFHNNTRKRLVKSPKVYVRDSGVLHALAGIKDFEMLQGHVLLGRSWEGYVLEQIGQFLPAEWQIHFYRSHQGAEMDCVLVRGGEPLISIEIKYSASPKLDRGNRQALTDMGTKYNFIITPRNDRYELDAGVVVTGLKEFLAGVKSLLDGC